MKVDGFREMERQLARLKQSTAKGVVRRVLKQTLAPVADTADAYSPHFQIAVTTRLSPRQRGLARSDFVGHVVSMYVGPVTQDGSHAPHAHLVEFGTGPRYHASGKYVGAMPPDPFMRPAWEAHRATILDDLGRKMWTEIEKALARAEARGALVG